MVWTSLKEKSKIAVYDLGGGTFDLSILELNEGVFQVLSTNGNTRLGGDDLDRRIVEFLAEKIKIRKDRTLLDDLPMLSRIREAAEQAKINFPPKRRRKSPCRFSRLIFRSTTS